MKLILACWVLLLMAVAGDVYSQVTITYDAVVTTSFGQHAAALPIGERVVVSYTLNAAALDSNIDPNRGDFDNAVLSMSVVFPGLGLFAHAGPQTTIPYDAAIFLGNDTVDASGTQISDIVYVHAGPITNASTLGGESISHMVLEFGDYVAAPAAPSMITSDALPLFNLSSPYPY